MSDTLTAEEQRLLDQMAADEASEPQQPQEPAPRRADAQPEPGAEQPPPQEQPAMVDKRALDEERTRRRELAAKLAEVERKAAADQARVEERLRLLTEAAQAHVAQPAAPATPEPPAPDFATDPAGYIQYGFKQLQAQNEQLMQRLQQVETGATQLTQAQREQQEAIAIRNWGIAQEEEFARTKPDYRDAMQHLLQARERMVRALPGMNDPATVRAAIEQDVHNIMRMARDRGQNAGQVFYALAEASGYAPRAAGTPAVAPNGGGAAPALPSAETAAERLVRGQEMATTLGATGGAPRGELTATALAAMSDEEFANFHAKIQKQGAAAMRQIYGA